MHDVYSFIEFQALTNTSNLELGLDDSPISDDDVAEVAKQLWDEFMLSDNDEEDDDDDNSIIAFKEHMSLLSQSNHGFRCVFIHDPSGKCTGCIWQTATMRDNFETFGGFLAVDAMKRGTNDLIWPYMEITICNELNMICLGCEGVVTAERLEAYKAMVCFVLDSNFSSRSHKEIHVVAADGAVNQNIVRDVFKFPNAHFIADQWHIFDSVLPKRFGETHFDSVKSLLRNMCNAKSEDEHTTAFESAITMLQNNVHSSKPLDEMCKFRNDKECHAHCITSSKRGTKGRHGSSLDESNHSSALVFLNDGERLANHYSQKPVMLVKDLFRRQAQRMNKFNQELCNQQLKLDVEHSRFDDSTPQLLRDEIDCLCFFLMKNLK